MRPIIKFLIGVILLVLTLIIVAYIILPLFGFDFIRQISSPPQSLKINSEPRDYSNRNYNRFELSEDGMVLEKDVGESDITKALAKKPNVYNCGSCPMATCYWKDLNGDGIINSLEDTYQCGECDMCDGKVGIFNNCYNCDPSSMNCSMCENTNDEDVICSNIKRCMLESLSIDAKTDGCYITEVSHLSGTSFNINDFLNIIKSCNSESIKIYVGNDVTRELCFYNSSDVSYYDNSLSEGLPYDFYNSYVVANNVQTAGGMLYKDSLSLTPSYRLNGQSYGRYRVYVALNASNHPNSIYQISVAGIKLASPLPPPSWSEDTCYLGVIQTDSNGFANGEFDISPCLSQNSGWRENPDLHPLNGVLINLINNPGVADAMVYVAFYSNYPQSNGVWSDELRYSNDNIITDPEPYLKDKPWWVVNSTDNLNSPWYLVSGNPNSSIKVYYDSSMAGGGDSTNRGQVKIRMGKFDPNFMRQCKFNIYVSSQDSFAQYGDERILDLFNFFSNFNPSNVQKVEDFNYKNGKGIIYNYVDFALDKNYTTDEIMSAIKSGFRIWEQSNFIANNLGTGLNWLMSSNNNGIYEDKWIESKDLASYDGECWNKSLDKILNDTNEGNQHRYLIGNCPQDNCNSKLRVKIAFKQETPDALHLFKSPLYPLISFCGYGTTQITTQPNCSNSFRDDDLDGLADFSSVVLPCNINRGGAYWPLPGVTCTNGGDPHCFSASDNNEGPTKAFPIDMDYWTSTAGLSASLWSGGATIGTDNSGNNFRTGTESIKISNWQGFINNPVSLSFSGQTESGASGIGLHPSSWQWLTFQVKINDNIADNPNSITGINIIIGDSAGLNAEQSNAMIECPPQFLLEEIGNVIILI